MEIFEPKTREEFDQRLAQPAKARGLYRVPDVWYHGSDGVSRSDFVRVLRSPKFYRWKKDNPEKPTDALTFGTAFHTAFLEPEKFNDQVAVGPSVGKRTKGWKDFVALNEDKIVLHPNDFDVLNEMLESLRNNDLAMSLLRTKVRELSAYNYYDDLLIKARADAIDLERNMLVDLKTTQDASLDKFSRSAAEYKYHVQAAFYLDTFNAVSDLKLDKFVFVCVEKKPPYDVQSYVCDPEMIKLGRETYRKALNVLAECERTNQWKGYAQIIMNLTLPRWAI